MHKFRIGTQHVPRIPYQHLASDFLQFLVTYRACPLIQAARAARDIRPFRFSIQPGNSFEDQDLPKRIAIVILLLALARVTWTILVL